MRVSRYILIKSDIVSGNLYWVNYGVWSSDRKEAKVFLSFDECQIRADQQGGTPIKA